jgi:hypothetical protein
MVIRAPTRSTPVPRQTRNSPTVGLQDRVTSTMRKELHAPKEPARVHPRDGIQYAAHPPGCRKGLQRPCLAIENQRIASVRTAGRRRMWRGECTVPACEHPRNA